MEVWGAAAICEGWSTFFSLLSHLLIEVKRDVKTHLTITKVDFYLSELRSRLSCLLSLLALLGTEEEPSVADSDERGVQFVRVHIESIVEYISQEVLPLLRAKQDGNTSSMSVGFNVSFKDKEEQICHLRSIGFSWTEISDLFGVSRMTLYRMRQLMGLTNDMCKFSDVSESDLKDLILQIKSNFPDAGERIVLGAIRAQGLRVQRHRVRSLIHTLDPINTPLRWTHRIHRKPYSVPGPMCLWHIGKFKLI